MKCIQSLDAEREILTADDYQKISAVNARRNFYVHSCYVGMAFDAKTDALKEEYIMQFLPLCTKDPARNLSGAAAVKK